MSNRSRAELALLAVTVIWGTSFVIVKSAIDEASTFVFLSARFLVATVALALLFANKLRRKPELRSISIRAGLAAGACLTVGYVFQTVGLRHTTPAKSAFLTGITTLVVPFFAAIVYKAIPHLSEGIGALVATAGLGLMTLPADRFTIGYGDALTLCCTVAFACHILVLGRYSAVSSFEWLCLTQIAATAALALAGSVWLEPPKFSVSPKFVMAVLATGLLSTALAFTVQTWAQRYTSPSRAALVFAVEPVSAMATSYLVAGEVLTFRAVLGAILILIGVLVAELKPLGVRQHPQE